jgi:2-C-methyl-D-erythritol 4-phosphate cytidylyltransferase
MSRRSVNRDSAVAIVPAGGMGVRMGRSQPKQYLSLAGRPLFIHTLQALLSSGAIARVVLAVPNNRVEATRRVLRRHGIERAIDVLEGGSSRQESVWCGLQAIPVDARWVVVHDAVRPFITGDLVERLLEAARRVGAATCGLEVRDTLKRVVGGETVHTSVDRDGLWLTQTPQVFRRDLLWEAHDKARRDGFAGTDDAMLVERLGAPVAMVAGFPYNIKITTPDDLRIARSWLTGRRLSMRS